MILNISYYDFFSIEEPALLQKEITIRLSALGVLGTVLMAHEGINFNLAGPQEKLRDEINSWLSPEGLLFKLGAKSKILKESLSETIPFRHLRVKVKKEIVTMGQPELDVSTLRGTPLSPVEFKNVLLKMKQGDESWVILDVRNEFEVNMGSFEGATRVGMKTFRDFPNLVDKLQSSNQDLQRKNIAMFCTGGVRCEKASALMRVKGFSNVYQLEGGILKYFEECSRELFQGECFVFDERETLDPSEIPAHHN